jgi:hypothetical protein
VSGQTVPVYFLDTALEQNSPWDRTLTDYLYGGDQRYRLCQEVVLGMGGVAMLRALGHQDVPTFHMNEGHSAFLTLALRRSLVREPDAGNPHVRFDEREVETEHGEILGHRQPKGSATRKAHLHHRATSRLYRLLRFARFGQSASSEVVMRVSESRKMSWFLSLLSG